MKKLYIPYILSAACLFTACSTFYDEADSVTPGEKEMLSLTVSASDIMESNGISSRSSEENGITTFEDGDCVGLIVLDEDNNLLVDNVPFKYENDNWVFAGDVDKIPYYDAAMSNYIVYYPYKEEVNRCKTVDEIMSKDAFKPLTNQNSEVNYRQADVLVWHDEGKTYRHIVARMEHVYDSFTFHINLKWELVSTGEVIEYHPLKETLKDFKIEFTPDEGDKLTLFDNDIDEDKNLMYHPEDGTYRYLLSAGEKGKITWHYTYRGITFRGEREISAETSGTRYVHHETADMGELPGSNMEIGDFYCSVAGAVAGQEVTGYVFPWDGADQINENSEKKEAHFVGRQCIGIVVGVGQHDNDFSNYEESGIYKQSEIKGNKCHGYAMALTDTGDDVEWAKRSTQGVSKLVGTYAHADEKTKSLYDWNGFYNHQKIGIFIEDNGSTEWSDFPASNACINYGEVLKAPDNTTGWFLPSLGMIEFVWKKNEDIETASTVYKMADLLKERFVTIKKYLADENDPDNDEGQNTFKSAINGLRSDKYYWSSTEINGDNSGKKAIAAGFMKNQSQFKYEISTTYSNIKYPHAVRPFLAF